MFRYVTTIVVAILLSAPLVAGVTPFPASFHTQMVPTNGTSLCVRVGGKGPAVVLLHGFGFTGDMWAPLAIVLAKDHTVIVPDLRGMGMSDHPDTGYTKKNRPLRDLGVSSGPFATSMSNADSQLAISRSRGPANLIVD